MSELNPEEFRNGQGRIIRRDKDAPPGAPAVEMIYLRSVKSSAEAADERINRELQLYKQEHPGDEAF